MPAYIVDSEQRRTRPATANARSLAGREALPDQGEVWANVSTRWPCGNVITNGVDTPDFAPATIWVYPETFAAILLVRIRVVAVRPHKM